LVPEPHGVSRSHVEEFSAFSRRRWKAEFERANFEIIAILKGPVASGYGFGFEGLRRFLERLGVTSEYIYVARKRGAASPYARYFVNGSGSCASSR